MALTGKPSVIEARAASAGETSAALRPLQSVIAAIRERLRLIEAELNALITRTADVATGGTAGASFNSLQEQINALRLRIEALEAITLTDWYVNGGFVATRRVVNFIQAGGITISGGDDGNRANITFGALVDILIPLSLSPTVLLLTGRQVTFQLGRFIDVSRRSLVLSGRTLGLSLTSDTLLTVNRGSLRLAGRNVGLGLTQDVDLPVARGALRLAGRNVGLGANLAVARGHFGLSGRDVGLSVSAGLNLGVARGRLILSGRDVAIVAGASDFYRNFADLSTANLTVYRGTVSAATGKLVGTPDSGAVHERVYFDLLPPGSPQTISGAFDITMNITYVGSSTAATALLWFTQADSAADATLANGYFLDDASTLQRAIKLVGGGATVMSSASGGFSPGHVQIKLSHDGAGNYVGKVNGVTKTTFTDTTYTSGRFGILFFANPGPSDSIIDYGINYTP